MTYKIKPTHPAKYETSKKVFGLEGKRLIGHSKDEDFYEDTQGNTYSFDGKKLKKLETKPYRIVQQESTASGSIEVWQLPKSQYAIQYLKDEKGDNRWRVIEVYISDGGEIRTRGDLPYKDYDSYTKALEHIEYNYKIEKEM